MTAPAAVVPEYPSKGLQGIKVLLPVLKLVGVVCASRMRLVTNSP